LFTEGVSSREVAYSREHERLGLHLSCRSFFNARPKLESVSKIASLSRSLVGGHCRNAEFTGFDSRAHAGKSSALRCRPARRQAFAFCSLRSALCHLGALAPSVNKRRRHSRTSSDKSKKTRGRIASQAGRQPHVLAALGKMIESTWPQYCAIPSARRETKRIVLVRVPATKRLTSRRLRFESNATRALSFGRNELAQAPHTCKVRGASVSLTSNQVK